MKRIVIALSLFACQAARADVVSFRLHQAPGEVTLSAEKPNTVAGKMAAVETWLEGRFEAFDADDPMCRSLVWFYGHQARSVDGSKQIRLNEKYFNIGVEYFNHAQQLYQTIATDSPQPAEWLAGWRGYYARRVIEERLKLPVEPEKKLHAGIPATKTIVQPATADQAKEAIAKAYQFDGLSPRLQARLMRVLSSINPGLAPNGFYVTRGKVSGGDGMLQIAHPAGDGWGQWKRVDRYKLSANTALLLPSAQWVRGRSQLLTDPAGSATASKPANEVFCIELTTALRNDIPLRVFLTRQGQEFTYAWAATASVSNRPHDVLIVEDDPDKPKLSLAVPTGEKQTDRLLLELDLHAVTEGLAGTFVGERDMDDRKEAVKGEVKPVALSEALPPGDKLAGRWGWYMGPRNCARSGQDEVQLVEDLETARLAWVSDEQIPVGRGPDTRGKVEPVRFETLSGGWASPVTDGKRVYVSYYEPSGKHYAWGAEKAVEKNPEDRHLYRLNLIEADDVIHCFDARTGRTLWKRRYEGSGMSWSGFNKSGPEMSPCVADGKVFAVGTLGDVFCVDAETGRTLWRNDIGRRARLLRFQRGRLIARGAHFGSRSDFSTRVVPAGKVVVICDHVRTKGGDDHYRYELHNGLKAFDRETGRELWHLPQVGSVASRWTHKGKEYILASGLGTIRCIEPNTGKVLWEAEGDSSLVPLANTEDRLLCEVPAGRKTRRIRCMEISPGGAKILWDSKVFSKNNTPIAIGDGYAYLPVSRQEIACLSMVDGSVAGTVAHGGSNSANIVGGGRMLLTPDQSHSKPIVLYIKTDPTDFRLLDAWNVRISGSYTTPLMMPLVDGRLVMRFRNRLVCYDLRKSSAVTDRKHAWSEGGVGSIAPPKPKLEPEKSAEPIQPTKPVDKPKGPSLPDLDDGSLDPLEL